MPPARLREKLRCVSFLRDLSAFLREVYACWSEDRALTHGAALAYYTLFSLAPLLVLVIAVAGLALGRAAAQGEIVAEMADLVGESGARMIEGMVARASAPTTGFVAGIASLATMVFGASGVVGQLQSSLNQIWKAPPPPPTSNAVRSALRRRAVAVGLILGVGFLLLVSLVISAALSALHDLAAAQLPVAAEVVPPINFAFSFLIITSLFAMIYKILPDVRLEWRDVWVGAAITAVLFSIGKSLIGIYLGRAGVTSVYGAAGSLVLVLLWIYYSAQLLFVGAEFTEVYARRYGSRREPSSAA
ncbi:MAG: YihY/virulence factor BrkB family protein [Deltaproteobacteria bacterium]|nr:YihY/virulence factor BrkB family protein [Deltaproteobacteria bacterium]